jgi:hypothetical protein
MLLAKKHSNNSSWKLEHLQNIKEIGAVLENIFPHNIITAYLLRKMTYCLCFPAYLIMYISERSNLLGTYVIFAIQQLIYIK